MKTTTTTLKNEFKSSPMSEDNTYIAEPDLNYLTLKIVQLRTILAFSGLKVLKMMYGVMTLSEVSLLDSQMATNSALGRNLVCLVND